MRELRGFFKFWIGDTVYLKTDPDQNKHLVTAISIRPNCISYECSKGRDNSWHYDFEISYEIDVIVKTDS